MATEGNEPAYPIVLPEGVGINTYSDPGLTKREYFAAMAMQGMMTSMGQLSAHPSEYGIGKQAVAIADDLIRALNSVKQQ